MNRREFLKRSLITAVPVILPEYNFLKDYSDYKYIKPVKSQRFAKVVSYRDPKCVSDDFKIDEKRGAELFNKALLEFTGKKTIKEAVQSLFPKFKNDLKVAIKINTASSLMPSHLCIAEAIADSLVEAGLDPYNVIIWEREEQTLKNAGYKIADKPGRFRVIGTDTKGYGYVESKTERVHGVPVYLTSIITKYCDYQINLGVMKHHWFTGIATTLKNHYGSIPLFDKLMMIGLIDLVRLHLNACDPYIGELNVLINEKTPTILHVCDGLLGAYNNGPLGPPQWVQNEIIISKDPVAIDTLSLYRVEKKRKDIGLPPLLNKAMFLRTSANMGLGTNNTKNMEIINKII